MLFLLNFTMDFISAFSNFAKEFKDIFLSRKLIVIATYFTVGSLLLLLLPTSILEFFNIKNLRDTYSEHIGATAFLTGLLVLSGIVYIAASNLYNKRKDKLKAEKIENQRLNTLRELTPEESRYLRKYIEKTSQTVVLGKSDGVAQGLENKGILYCTKDYSPDDPFIAYNMETWAYKILVESPELIGLKKPEGY